MWTRWGRPHRSVFTFCEIQMNLFKKLFGSSAAEAPLSYLERVYTRHLGEISSVFHETQDRGSHVDVYRFNPRKGRDFVTYITGGMSRRAQPECTDLPYVELVFYATHHDVRFPEVLRQFSHYPWETGAAFLGWDLLPLGDHAATMLGSPRFGGLLVCPSTRREDHDLAMAMRALDRVVSPLNLIPLLHDEFEYAVSAGIKELLDRVSASQHSLVLSHSRESVLSDTREKNADGAAPNGGPTTPPANSGATEGPPSVS